MVREKGTTPINQSEIEKQTELPGRVYVNTLPPDDNNAITIVGCDLSEQEQAWSTYSIMFGNCELGKFKPTESFPKSSNATKLIIDTYAQLAGGSTPEDEGGGE